MNGTNQSEGRASEKVQIIAQGHLLQLRIPSKAARPKGRGLVPEFSSQSRNRMIRLLARIDLKAAGYVCFVTLTYPDADRPVDSSGTERDRQVFLKRMKRFAAESSGIWRREWTPRLSGVFKGAWFPHYHFLFFNLPFLPHTKLNELWAEVIGHEGYVRTEIEGIRHWKLALHYVSKYMAKPVENMGSTQVAAPPFQGGRGGLRRWSSLFSCLWLIFDRKSA